METCCRDKVIVCEHAGCDGLALSAVGPQSGNTARIVMSAGAKHGSSGNMRTGLKALGIYTDFLRDLHKEVSDWQRRVIGTYESDLEKMGLF